MPAQSAPQCDTAGNTCTFPRVLESGPRFPIVTLTLPTRLCRFPLCLKLSIPAALPLSQYTGQRPRDPLPWSKRLVARTPRFKPWMPFQPRLALISSTSRMVLFYRHQQLSYSRFTLEIVSLRLFCCLNERICSWRTPLVYHRPTLLKRLLTKYACASRPALRVRLRNRCNHVA